MPKHFDFVLLGGGPAGVSAAETLRAEGATGSILLVSGDLDLCCAAADEAIVLDAGRIGVEVSEGFQLHPEQSTTAIVCHHPQAKYFVA